MRAGFIAFFLMVGWWVLPHQAAAAVAITTGNSIWQTATKLGTVREPIQLYGALGSTGDVRFYQVVVNQAEHLNAMIDVPVWADPKFHPQLVVYQPDSSTNGPSLPMVQPPGTIALVYPLTDHTRHFEAWTQISTVERLQAKLDFPVPGTYYLAIYNADSSRGRFRLTLAPGATNHANGILTWPKCWWISQMWANPSVMTLFAPLVLIVIIIAIAWCAMHWTDPKKQSHTKKVKSSSAKRVKKT